jgi:hypothetical protein
MKILFGNHYKQIEIDRVKSKRAHKTATNPNHANQEIGDPGRPHSSFSRPLAEIG